MSWSNYEKALALLNQNKVDCDYIGECLDLLIKKAENTLDLKFPSSYNHFIKKYGAGVFANYEILGVIHEKYYELLDPDKPDVVRFTLIKRKERHLPDNFLPIIDIDPDILYCLDINNLNEESEPAVVSFNVGEDWGEQELIAEDFGDFLLEIIQNEIEALKLSPIKIIYDVVDLKGTCYVEIKPGKFTGHHWNKESIYFTDETFTYLSLSIEKMY
ncbi:SMI1/KNR4 family protein, partial [Bacillus sp. JJ722]|uniref:SMI1/KNR4 family protein n=1 Tax=Bacillus sp. JJ722 TaxID=3122973 RepID=UPI002FFFCD2F